MNIEEIRDLIHREYSLEADNIDKIKNVYRIQVHDKFYCLKIIKYVFGHFLFLFSAMKHLQNKGFQRVPEFILNKEGKDYIEIEGKYAYMTPWAIARESNYDNPIDLSIAARKLGELHKKSLGFELLGEMRPRVGWMRWIEIFTTRRNEILDFKRRIYKKENKTEFDEFYLSFMEEELCRCNRAIENIKNSDYEFVMKNEIKKRGFCHHDYANHNILIDTNGEVNIIDFDYCILDTHLHDLSSLLIRRMKNGKWSLDNAEYILKEYDKENRVYHNEIPIMASFMEFPQAYWQVGIQYYWEEQPWGEEFFMRKLTKIFKDREERQEFIDEFREGKFLK